MRHAVGGGDRDVQGFAVGDAGSDQVRRRQTPRALTLRGFAHHLERRPRTPRNADIHRLFRTTPHRIRLRPGAVEQDEAVGALVVSQVRQRARGLRGIEQSELLFAGDQARLVRLAIARMVHQDDAVFEAQLGEAHGPDRVEALAGVLEDADAGPVRDARSVGADAQRARLVAAIAGRPSVRSHGAEASRPASIAPTRAEAPSQKPQADSGFPVIERCRSVEI